MRLSAWFTPRPPVSCRPRLLGMVRHPSFSQNLAARFAAGLSTAEIRDVWSATTDLLHEPLEADRRLAYVVLRDELLRTVERRDAREYDAWLAELWRDPGTPRRGLRHRRV